MGSNLIIGAQLRSKIGASEVKWYYTLVKIRIYCDFNVRDSQLIGLLDIGLEVFKTYSKIDFSEGVLKKLNFCIL